MSKASKSLLKLQQQSVSPWHTVLAGKKILSENGFQELSLGADWAVVPSGKYFVSVFDTSLFAFTIGEGGWCEANALRIAAAHTDFPGLRIKPQAEILKNKYGILNVETYGGLILQSWFDRPLSMAGKVVTKGENPFAPQIHEVNLQKPLFIIPSLAIHMNPQINKGVAIKKQKEVVPLATVTGEEISESFFRDYLAQVIDCAAEDILSWDLNLYPCEKGCFLGLQEELLSAPRLDNITSVEACLQGLMAGGQKFINTGIRMVALFDNEEIGSRTKQGAASSVLGQILERLYTSLGCSKEAMFQAIHQGFMLSVDVAHGYHPNYPEKSDPTSQPRLNQGVVLKRAASQSYAGDAEAVAIITALCQSEDIPYQNYVNNSDIPGGSTLGSIASALVPIRTMDIGVPILAMHSARETMGVEDQKSLNQLLSAFLA